ncbi:MAG: lipid A deacylase LpxR family protein [Flavobacteriia bacterium]|nr:lipid A deacylase LpxR family protein [Flavobacteriia bacterium]OIP45858.1 MAG: hypothetical protein AUK46_10905 [Flavobacteriaceae bacterium CG2_30_31_66]PIV97761.1 MAG: DUF2219 domain-containing protein [Flavobacteriaceae bacterium CG17_big_fil_post_rev_8_21_14_2_50_31_13]PIY15154.1 MAG: DUF2219 domain-containing protein [Flavobacteriaceae bacterium CG_4_10_14_3_um_filter_31_253]PIZ09480.1 MAG: DUF2219 domain-containing protein [Flavobacteriaceae bacterium CG_4_10_14_0_8_um_filter_31_99]P
MKFKTSFFFFFCSIWIYSQQKFSKEISFVNDNDLYVSTIKDRYYTNGVSLSYRFLSSSIKENLEKRILQWQIGHKMYTPYKAIVTSIEDHDRAFAAYVFGGFGFTNVYKTNQIFSSSVEVGVIGKNAFGKELQDFIHDLYGFKKATGWQYQIKNALGININASYDTFLAKISSDFVDLTWVNSASVGTVFTNISSGFYGRIGLNPLQKITNSIAFKSNLNNQNTNDTREVESFLFIKPSVKYNLYDATIEGSFLNSNSEVTTEIISLVFQLEIGFRFTANKFQFGYVYNFNTNESKGLRFNKGNTFGTIAIHYLVN